MALSTALTQGSPGLLVAIHNGFKSTGVWKASFHPVTALNTSISFTAVKKTHSSTRVHHHSSVKFTNWRIIAQIRSLWKCPRFTSWENRHSGKCFGKQHKAAVRSSRLYHYCNIASWEILGNIHLPKSQVCRNLEIINNIYLMGSAASWCL